MSLLVIVIYNFDLELNVETRCPSGLIGSPEIQVSVYTDPDHSILPVVLAEGLTVWSRNPEIKGLVSFFCSLWIISSSSSFP